MASDLYAPPFPDEDYDRERVEHTRLRRRMLSGAWGADLDAFLAREIGPVRLRSWGNTGDKTKNVFRNVVNQLSVLYDQPPIIANDQPGAADELTKILEQCGLWQLAPRLQQTTIGLREGLYRVGSSNTEREGPQIHARIVSPDMVFGYGSYHAPDEPIVLNEYRIRRLDQDDEWTIDHFDITPGRPPAFRVLSANEKEDLSGVFLDSPGGLEGDAYPYWKTDENGDSYPFIPYILYHAERHSNGLFDPFEGYECVEGSLVVALLWTFWRNCVQQSSWPQRYAVGVRPAGGRMTQAGENMAYIPTDPASLLNFEVSGDATPILGQFKAGSDPVALGEAIRAYSADLSMDMGISSTDLARVSANPRSGYAIALSREGVRGAQRRAEPQFRRGDLETIDKICALWNATTGDSLPVSGWSISYPGVPLSSDEKTKSIEEYKALVELGVASPVDLYRMIYNTSKETATFELERIALERARFT
jgi:hypothetical protein